MDQPPENAAPNRRIIVMVPDEPGQLARIAGALAEADINIQAIDGRQAGELGVITLSTSDDDDAMRVLLKANFRAVASDAVVFYLPDQPGALAGVAQRFEQERINVRTIHIMHHFGSVAVVAVTTDDDDLARALIGGDYLL